MTRRSLLSDITPPTDDTDCLTAWEQAWSQREFAIGAILDQISNDHEVRNRVRDHLKTLASDKPGPRVGLTDVVIYHVVEDLRTRGHTLQSAFDFLSHEKLTAESVRKKYQSGKRIAAKSGKN